jgi:formylglycine-generating enzyme required for sulfatase activity/tRNA A-37 threonylcarbamoyl transferase component Bud32
MGAVYKARQRRMDRLVALKVIRRENLKTPGAVERFQREARAAAKLAHPNVVTVFDSNAVGGVHFLVMEYLEGTDLAKLVKGKGPLPVGFACEYIRQAALGLQHAHEQGLIHRDIKPHNLMLTKQGVVKVMDLGLARTANSENETTEGLTATGAVMGTADYIAPEQALNAKGVDIRADIYSLGCSLYHLLTGQVPFPGESMTEKLLAHQLQEPEPIEQLRPGLPKGLAKVVQTMMAKKPEQRYATPGKLAQALAPFAPSEGPIAAALPVAIVAGSAQDVNTSTVDATQADAPKSTARTRSALGRTLSLGFAVLRWTMLRAFALLRWTTRTRRRFLISGALTALLVGTVLLLTGMPDWASRVRQRPGEKDSPNEFTNSLNMKFMLIPAGKFTMGAPQAEIDGCLKVVGDGWLKDHLLTEGPEHEVQISRPFYLGATKVTVGQFRQFVNEKNYLVGDERWRSPGFEQTETHPVVLVSWHNAVDFCAWLSEKEGKTYRLPTEAEWEYGCRAGRSGARYCFGNAETDLGLYAWFTNNSEGKTHPVGKLKPNDWGLFDMHGNAWEWCWDSFDPNYYKNSPRKDPLGGVGDERLRRGGSWSCPPELCRAASRHHFDPGSRFNDMGFRVICEIPREGTITNSIGMKLVAIPAGKFTMGSPQPEIDHWLKIVGENWEKAHLPGEGPEHEVEISRPFYMGATEVTVGQFRQFVTQKNYLVGDDRWKNPGWEQTDDHPVVFVSWNNAVDFCTWLSSKEGKTYRLPTEAEWEYSCRAGTRTRYSFGDSEADLPLYAWFNGNAQGRTHPVRQLHPNRWGLFGMHGNAWEWCQDSWDPNYYKNSPRRDPPGGSGGIRVARGGGWLNVPLNCRSAFRSFADPGHRNDIGFRVLRVSSSPR